MCGMFLGGESHLSDCTCHENGLPVLPIRASGAEPAERVGHQVAGLGPAANQRQGQTLPETRYSVQEVHPTNIFTDFLGRGSPFFAFSLSHSPEGRGLSASHHSFWPRPFTTNHLYHTAATFVPSPTHSLSLFYPTSLTPRHPSFLLPRKFASQILQKHKTRPPTVL